MSCVWMLQRGYSGDGCVLASTLCKLINIICLGEYYMCLDFIDTTFAQ